MLFNWFKMVVDDATAGQGGMFVEKVSVARRLHRVDRFVVLGWTLILGKCVLASWAIRRWDIPIADFYVWGPSIIFGALCTYLYLARGEE